MPLVQYVDTSLAMKTRHVITIYMPSGWTSVEVEPREDAEIGCVIKGVYYEYAEENSDYPSWMPWLTAPAPMRVMCEVTEGYEWKVIHVETTPIGQFEDIRLKVTFEYFTYNTIDTKV